MTEYKEKIYKILPKIRQNSVALVDSFDMPDSSLCNFLDLVTNLPAFSV